jgi:DNA-binding response OmpR family regulator
MHVLIVNDRHSEVWFIQRVLQKMELDVDTAFDGEEGLRKLSGSIPGLIVLDTIMPKMDGYAFYQKLNGKHDTAQIPVLLITDKGEQFEKPKLLSVPTKTLLSARSRTPEFPRGNILFLNKPIQPDDLERKVHLLLNPTIKINDIHPAALRRPLVLIIDDDISLTTSAARALQAIGVDTITAAGGLAGLNRAKEDSPDMVVLDTILPELNGLQVLQYIKQHCQVPVMMIPGKAEADLLNKALLCGADSYLIKPFEPESLASFVQNKLIRINKLVAATL